MPKFVTHQRDVHFAAVRTLHEGRHAEFSQGQLKNVRSKRNSDLFPMFGHFQIRADALSVRPLRWHLRRRHLRMRRRRTFAVAVRTGRRGSAVP